MAVLGGVAVSYERGTPVLRHSPGGRAYRAAVLEAMHVKGALNVHSVATLLSGHRLYRGTSLIKHGSHKKQGVLGGVRFLIWLTSMAQVESCLLVRGGTALLRS